jgi:iron complex transport system substrate-binding protein
MPFPGPAGAAGVLVTDSAGRQVRLPSEIHRILAAGPPAGVFLYALIPGKLIGWPHGLEAGALPLLPAKYAALPVVGRLTSSAGGLTAAKISALRPDVIVDIGDVEPRYVALANRLQAQTGIPYLLFDGHLADSPASLRSLGAMLGAADGGEAAADYAAQDLRAIAIGLATVPQAQRLRIYYARGAMGLETVTSGSLLGEVFELAGGANVVPASGDTEITKVSLTQVQAWDPDVIVTEDPAVYRRIMADPRWASMKALQEKRLYLAPQLPFGWIDEPPGVNRLLGLSWLAERLYPAVFHDDLRKDAKEFFALFYHRAPSESELDSLLAPNG